MNNSINLQNISNSYFFKLNDHFRIELFQKCLKYSGKWKNLAKRVGYSPERLRSIKNGKCIGKGKKIEVVLISKPLLLKLIKISKIPFKEVEKHILEIRKNSAAKPIPIKLPIKSSIFLASVIGNSLGDGSLRANYFIYGNTELALVKKLENSINHTFNCKINSKLVKITRPGKEFYTMVYPGTISDILNKFGAPLNSKLTTEFDVPKWIRYGNKDIKSAFVRSLFDDESHVSRRDKNIVINMSKEKKLEKSLKRFLNSIRSIIKDQGIEPNKVTKFREYSCSKGEKRSTLAFTISGKDNLIKYKNVIGFNHPKKIKDINTVLNSYKLICYKPDKVYDKIVTFLSIGSKTTEEVSNHINRDLETARIHLNLLFKQEKINKQSRGPTVWSLGG